jgi:hypothetical protein
LPMAFWDAMQSRSTVWGNIWVENDYVNVTVYSQSYVYGSPTTLLRTLSPAFPVYDIAVPAFAFFSGTLGPNAIVVEDH